MQFDWMGIYALLPADWQELIRLSNPVVLARLQEIRVRQGQPVLAYATGAEYLLGQKGFQTQAIGAVRASAEHIRHLLATVSKNSLYALEEELRSGYVTVAGGHRIGLAGRAVVERGRVKTLKHITGFNIRLARQVKGCAKRLLPALVSSTGLVDSTLIVSPPQAGKTTLLRDLARALSTGEGLKRGYKVSIIDERSELAACYQGVPQLDVGPRSDVLDACPKAEGMMMALRSLSPEVLVTDEIGRREDTEAIEEAVHCGVSMLVTAHGQSFEELERRPALASLLNQGAFGRFVFLSNRQGPGTIEGVYDRQRRTSAALKGGTTLERLGD